MRSYWDPMGGSFCLQGGSFCLHSQDDVKIPYDIVKNVSKKSSTLFRTRGKLIKKHFCVLARKMPKIKFFEGMVILDIQ